MKYFNRIPSVFSLLLLMFFPLLIQAQQSDIEMADTMRSNGKIYVVVAVLSVVLLGIIIFLISIDRKVKKLENQSGRR